MAACSAASAADQGPEWGAVPAVALQRILSRASTWQTPGPCLAATVCRTWRSAAAGCTGIRLLYAGILQPSHESFTAWLVRNGGKLEALSLQLGWRQADPVLSAFAEAAEAAAATGRPFPLHTLRVFGGAPAPSITGRLVQSMPHLRRLQVGVAVTEGASGDRKQQQADLLEQLAPLKQATQLQELYLIGSSLEFFNQDAVAQLLPASLQRLSWDGPRSAYYPNLTHLNNLTSLRLQRWYPAGAMDSKLPPGLKELELWDAYTGMPLADLQGQQQTLIGYTWEGTKSGPQLLPKMSGLKSVQVYTSAMEPCIPDGIIQLPKLFSLKVLNTFPGNRVGDLQPVVTQVASIKGLSCLQLWVTDLQPAPGVYALTALTRLVLQSIGDGGQEQLRSWAKELGRMANLRWLSVPDKMLVTEQAWLGGLKQLQVLVLSCGVLGGRKKPQWFDQVVQWLRGCSPQDMPPHLLLLGYSVTPGQALRWKLRGRVLPLVGSSGYEVVAGVDLDEVSDAMQQLAGWPTALQRALA